MNLISDFKQQVLTNFSLGARDYDQHADIQFKAASQLAQNMDLLADQIVSGSILEIGCGTGFLTEALAKHFPTRKIIASDISQQMLEKNMERLTPIGERPPQNLYFEIIDAENFDEKDTFAAIASSFTFQWFVNLEATLNALMVSLQSGGTLFFCLPGYDSFAEWKQLCREACVPFTGNPLPRADLFQEFADKHGYASVIEQKRMTREYQSILDFLKDIKAQGAATSKQGVRMEARQLMRLINYSDKHNPDRLSITYDIIFGQITKR
jgi:malonyl-CoA O-methyltransferase